MSEESNYNCVVCCQFFANNNKKWIYAIGSCDHLVCYECSTRMRVLCKQNECPICRQPINQVVFTSSRHKKFEEFDLGKCLYSNNYGIYFENEEGLLEYGKLQEHKCKICKTRPPFKSVHDLSTHLRKEHELFMCDLCVDNLKVFSNERKYYTRKELVRHRKTGDPDEKSHRGHPICKFCDVRYVDEDELQIHLRREHFYCHFCDPSGLKFEHFYNDYNKLRDHFLLDHFLCKECDGLEEKFTNAFSSEIDLQAHIAQLHSQNMSKSDLKKAKTLSLDMFVRQRSGHLPNDSQNRRKKDQRSRLNNNNNMDEIDSDSNLANDEFLSNNASATPVQPPRPEDFPQLCSNAMTVTNNVTNDKSNNSKAHKNSRKQNTFSICLTKNPKLNTRNDEEFPALPGSRDPKVNVSNSPINSKLTKQKAINSNGYKSQAINQQTKPNNISVNSLSPLNSGQQPFTQKYMKSKPLINSKEEFPSLPITKNKSGNRFSSKTTAKVSDNILDSKNSHLEWNNTLDNKSIKNEINPNKCEFKSNPSKSLTNLEEFPVLEVKKDKKTKLSTNLNPKPNPKPISKNPPPGITAIRKTSANLSLISVAQEVISSPAVDDLTKSVNSQNSNTNDYSYVNPIDFNERNQSLVKEVENVLGDHNQFCLFKEASKDFRRGLTSGDQYYQTCIELFGKNNFTTIFSELLVLLPDINKQNELLTAQQNQLKNTKGAIPKGSKILNDNNSSDFIICGICRQVLIIKDESAHQTQHMSAL